MENTELDDFVSGFKSRMDHPEIQADTEDYLVRINR